MKHPAHSAHQLEAKLLAVRVLLTESKNDEKAAILNMVKECQSTLEQLRKEMLERETRLQLNQQIFCDGLTFEFSTNEDFSDSYTRVYKDMVTDMETIKSIIFSERQLQNMSDEYLFARVTITDNDPEV